MTLLRGCCDAQRYRDQRLACELGRREKRKLPATTGSSRYLSLPVAEREGETGLRAFTGGSRSSGGKRARAGGLPDPGYSRDVTREDWIRAVDANMLKPIFFDPRGG